MFIYFVFLSFLFVSTSMALGDNPWDPRTGLMPETEIDDPEKKEKECQDKEDDSQCKSEEEKTSDLKKNSIISILA